MSSIKGKSIQFKNSKNLQLLSANGIHSFKTIFIMSSILHSLTEFNNQVGCYTSTGNDSWGSYFQFQSITNELR